MALFSMFSRKPSESQENLTHEERDFIAKVRRETAGGRPISPESYQQLRVLQDAWFERIFDLKTVAGINAIPESDALPRSPFDISALKSHTGEVYYYLRHKAYLYEESNQMELALACMRKSVALVRCRPTSFPDDYYPLARMLARAGDLAAAKTEKAAIDKMCGGKVYPDSILDDEYRRGVESRDFAWLQANLPDICPKSLTSYRRAKTQNTKNFQQMQKAAADLGRKI